MNESFRERSSYRTGFFAWFGLHSALAAFIVWRLHPPILPVRENAAIGSVAWGLAGGVALLLVTLANPWIYFKALGQVSPRVIAPRLAFFLINSIAEEIVWRGGPLSVRATVPFFAAVMVSTIGFAAFHILPHGLRGFRFHIGTGIFFSVLAYATGGILAPVIAHLAYNAAMLGKPILPDRSSAAAAPCS